MDTPEVAKAKAASLEEVTRTKNILSNFIYYANELRMWIYIEKEHLRSNLNLGT